MVWCSIYFSIMQRLKQNHKVGWWNRRRAWLHRFLFHRGSSSVNNTLLQQFSTKLLFNTCLQHSSLTLLYTPLWHFSTIRFSNTSLQHSFHQSSPTLVYNIASTSKGPNSWCIFISCFAWIEASWRLFKCKSTPCCQSNFCFLLFFLDGRRGAFVKSQEPRADPVMRSTWKCHRFLWILMVYLHIQAKKSYSIHILWYNPYLALHSEKKPCTSMHWNMNHQTSVPKFDPGGKRSLQCNQVDCSTCQGRRWKSPYQVDLAEPPAGWNIGGVDMSNFCIIFSPQERYDQKC